VGDVTNGSGFLAVRIRAKAVLLDPRTLVGQHLLDRESGIAFDNLQIEFRPSPFAPEAGSMSGAI